jgi:hypothetical protein
VVYFRELGNHPAYYEDASSSLEMIRRRATVLGVSSAVILGILVSWLFLSPLSGSAGQTRQDNVKIQGMGFFQVFDSQGRLVSQQTEHNSLYANGVNNMAACLSGVSTSGNYGGAPCTGVTNGIGATWTCNGGSNCLNGVITVADNTKDDGSCGGGGLACAGDAVATDALTPSGCNEFGTNSCVGWAVTATFPSELFTTSSCATSCTVTSAFSEYLFPGTVHEGSAFDDITGLSIALSPGDTLVVTITFTIGA